MRPRPHRPAHAPALLAAVVALAGASLAQTRLGALHGAAPGERLGERLAAVGDLDGDGIAELVVGHPGDDFEGTDSGRVDVLRGADGAALHTWYGDAPGDRLGETVAPVGDVDADGVPDVLYGSPWTEGEKGSGVVRSGATGAVIHLLRGLAPGDRAGWSLVGVGDVDLDGHADLAIGAPGVDTGLGADTGRVYLVSGATGGVPWLVDGAHAGLELGRTVFAVEDVTGDGRPDLIAGTPRVGVVGGYLLVVSGLDGAVVRSHEFFILDHNYETTGFSACALGDLDDDGTGDYAFGWTNASGVPQIRYRSGATGGSIRTDGYSTWNEELGLLDAGDVDGDGERDQVVGFVGSFGSPREYRVVSGATGSVITTVTADAVDDELGAALADVGDLDGDGSADVAFGAPGDATSGADAGAILTLSLQPAAPPPVCDSTPNSTGQAADLWWDGTASVTANHVAFRVSSMPASASGLIVYSPGTAPSPLGNGVLCVDPAPLGFVLRLPPETSDASGVLRHLLDVTAPPDPLGAITPGSTWYFQGWFRDLAAGGAGFDFSDLAAIRFFP